MLNAQYSMLNAQCSKLILCQFSELNYRCIQIACSFMSEWNVISNAIYYDKFKHKQNPIYSPKIINLYVGFIHHLFVLWLFFWSYIHKGERFPWFYFFCFFLFESKCQVDSQYLLIEYQFFFSLKWTQLNSTSKKKIYGNHCKSFECLRLLYIN